jgi:hypothetical protein
VLDFAISFCGEVSKNLVPEEVCSMLAYVYIIFLKLHDIRFPAYEDKILREKKICEITSTSEEHIRGPRISQLKIFSIHSPPPHPHQNAGPN